MPNHRRIEGVALDEADRRLIEALDRNARTSIADLARLIGLSPQSTSDRVKRLEDLGVVTQFTVRLDPAALGLGIGAYIRVRPAMSDLQRVSQLLTDIPEIVECDRGNERRLLRRKSLCAAYRRPRTRHRQIDSVRADKHLDHTVLSGPAEATLIRALAISAFSAIDAPPPPRAEASMRRSAFAMNRRRSCEPHCLAGRRRRQFALPHHASAAHEGSNRPSRHRLAVIRRPA